jgi:hypothetical protein
MSLKNPGTPPGIDPGTVRLVSQRLSHYATPRPHRVFSNVEKCQQNRSIARTYQYRSTFVNIDWKALDYPAPSDLYFGENWCFATSEKAFRVNVDKPTNHTYLIKFEFNVSDHTLIIIFIDCNWVDTRWQWSFNMLHMHGLWRLLI